MSYESFYQEESAASEMRDKFENALGTLDEDEQEHWRARLHFVTGVGVDSWFGWFLFLQNRGV